MPCSHLLGSGHIFLQILISLISFIGYWQLLLAVSVAVMPPAPNLVYTGASSREVRGGRCIMNCDTPLAWISPRAYKELKEPAGSPVSPGSAKTHWLLTRKWRGSRGAGRNEKGISPQDEKVIGLSRLWGWNELMNALKSTEEAFIKIHCISLSFFHLLGMGLCYPW